ncbi:DUF2156 domain-containing protein [Clostridium sp. P21]|uniref:DUF2156 domain-containing protein n=2 Tax=Clostridium muellerianum TaxID=2716538 RepID=A0A7Y0EI11_9CLOT|nr:DUF2156 domain-containing protein [Clostridium muellerianum]
MMNFKKLTLEDKDLFQRYTSPYTFLSCEYSFTTLYIWKDACDVKYTIYKNALIIKKRDFEGKYHFIQPLGYKKEDLKDIIEVLIKYKEENNIKYLFKDLEESFICEIKALFSNIDDFYIKEDRDNFDYLYEAKRLMSLSGKKLHGKKNHYNNFVKNYEYEVVEIKGEKVIRDVIEKAQQLYEEREDEDCMLYYELQAIKDIVSNMNKFLLKGIAVYVNGKLEAFSIGEKLNKDLAVIHIEKANKNINGMYSFINRTFIEKCFNDVKIVNREQDLGLEGLRKAKMSYYPLKLEKKFIFGL